MTRVKFEEMMNELGVPETEKKSNGGLIPDHAKYGSWLRRNDPIAFNEEYWNYKTTRK